MLIAFAHLYLLLIPLQKYSKHSVLRIYLSADGLLFRFPDAGCLEHEVGQGQDDLQDGEANVLWVRAEGHVNGTRLLDLWLAAWCIELKAHSPCDMQGLDLLETRVLQLKQL